MKNYDSIFITITTDDVFDKDNERIKTFHSITFNFLISFKNNNCFDNKTKSTLFHIKHRLNKVGFDTKFIKFDKKNDNDYFYCNLKDVDNLLNYQGNIRNVEIFYGYKNIKKYKYDLPIKSPVIGHRNYDFVLHNLYSYSYMKLTLDNDISWRNNLNMFDCGFQIVSVTYQIVEVDRKKKLLKSIGGMHSMNDILGREFFNMTTIKNYLRPGKVKKILG